MPEDVRWLTTLADPNYTYACEVESTAAGTRSAEQWARAVFEDAPQPLRSVIVLGWLVGLGLRLAPRSSSSHVLGWTIVAHTPTAVVLAVDSFLLSAQLVVRVHESNVIHATFVRYERNAARGLWPTAALIHQRVIPYLLTRAATRIV